MFKFNKFTKKPDSKTGYQLIEGNPIFDKSLYLLVPVYVHGRSPAFSLVAKGKHISGLYKSGVQNFFIGDHDKVALILIQRNDGLGFDLFKTDLPPAQARQMLIDGQLNDQLFEARRAV